MMKIKQKVSIHKTKQYFIVVAISVISYVFTYVDIRCTQRTHCNTIMKTMEQKPSIKIKKH